MSTIDIRMPDDEKEGTEASLATWLKAIGDPVSENEPLVEISTDKVTIEIPAPASGSLIEFVKLEGDRILPGDLLGRISTDAVNVTPQSEGTLAPPAELSVAASKMLLPKGSLGDDSFSPAVRRLLKEHGLDPRNIPKVSRGEHLTSEDITAYLENRERQVQEKPKSSAQILVVGRQVPHTPMRKSIANHMTQSLQTAPHVTAVFEADLSAVLSDRNARKAVAGAEGVPSVTAYLIHAALRAIRVVPEVNSKWHDTFLEMFDWVNFGIGTALDTGGLVVPVIRGAQEMDLLTLSQNLRAMTEKARSGKLTHSDMSEGTFTLSNHGVSGSLLAAPIIIPHGQAAILGAGKMQRRVIVCESEGRELFRIRPMMYVTLTVDHRVLDGQQTNLFLTKFVAALEAPNEPASQN